MIMSLENIEDPHIKIVIHPSLSKKMPFVIHNLQNHDSHLIFQETGKYDFKINATPKTIEKYTSFNYSIT